jgi:hypothetical protein
VQLDCIVTLMDVVIPKLVIRVMLVEHHSCSVCGEVNDSAICGQNRVRC